MYSSFINRAKFLHQKYNANLIFNINADKFNFNDDGSDNSNDDNNKYNPEDEDVVGFYCPNCNEIIYYVNWQHNDVDTENWTKCPICGFNGEE